MDKKTAISYGINFALIVLLFALLQFLNSIGIIDSYFQRILLVVGVNIILAVSLNLTVGFLGQLALGHAGFMAVGAYAAAIFTKSVKMDSNLELIISIIIAALFAGIVGIIIGVPALRIKGDYLAIITLGFGEIIRVIINNLSITGGSRGLSGIEAHAKFPHVYWVTVLCVVIVVLLLRSRHGRAIISIREDEIAAEMAGIPITYYKILGFATSAALTGVAGSLYAHINRVLNAEKFNFEYSIDILVIVVLGGMGSVTGSIIAAIVLTILPESLKFLDEYRMLIYSIALILMMIFRPSGLFGKYEFSLSKLIFKDKSKKAKPEELEDKEAAR